MPWAGKASLSEMRSGPTDWYKLAATGSREIESSGIPTMGCYNYNLTLSIDAEVQQDLSMRQGCTAHVQSFPSWPLDYMERLVHLTDPIGAQGGDWEAEMSTENE